MFNLIPFAAILIALAVIIVIVARKFPLLASLNVETIQAEREARFKERIISNRLKRAAAKWKTRWGKAWRPLFNLSAAAVKKAYERLREYNQQSLSGGRSGLADNDDAVSFLNEALEFSRQENYSAAEKKCIAAIGLEPKNYDAFRQLGKIYLAENNFSDAVQAFEHILKLQDEAQAAGAPEADGGLERSLILFDLSAAERGAGNLPAALSAANKALRLEPNNPRYLDTVIELCIITKDKFGAREALEKLATVNPENSKIGEFKKQIEQIP
ncbi:hypothetical protein COX69_03935 [Candidatus Falkowbacteria bacterium CG_4_10_14_0_2_um_filter_48_10]|uniref:Uncharacterized protein n=1 Tax=Candidatus Falkowbacteria bacterium CG23_combo_of_CG06-09_8_20_14_all_49_15 TaxID=1974572 RepID=A0A2G9ZL84_9BACT|nr:MAG: hypothetical protein COX22_01690 [Candidatus Falkowbacteria bacterium CG23_combo_of_CG06-09_8_20_14_all_49_15]PJA07724.1 MAG: hypothetical protein COX69_03935 [Candidatus Falkowbacteria bacterium CG_4_10_14_0_2_um_filter_48_10]